MFCSSACLYIRYKITLGIVWRVLFSSVLAWGGFGGLSVVFAWGSRVAFLLGLLVQSIIVQSNGRPDVLLVRKSNKWDYISKSGIFHSIVCNLNHIGVDLEICFVIRSVCMVELFSSGSVLFWVFVCDILLVWHFALPHIFSHVIFMCLSLLPWILEYIVLYHHSPWALPSFVVFVSRDCFLSFEL